MGIVCANKGHNASDNIEIHRNANAWKAFNNSTRPARFPSSNDIRALLSASLSLVEPSSFIFMNAVSTPPSPAVLLGYLII